MASKVRFISSKKVSRSHSSIGPLDIVCKLSFDIPSQEGDGVINAFKGPAGGLAMGRARLAKRCGGGIEGLIIDSDPISFDVLACRYALATVDPSVRARLVLLS